MLDKMVYTMYMLLLVTMNSNPRNGYIVLMVVGIRVAALKLSSRQNLLTSHSPQILVYIVSMTNISKLAHEWIRRMEWSLISSRLQLCLFITQHISMLRKNVYLGCW